MSRTAISLLVVLVAVLGASVLTYFSYTSDLRRAHAEATRGGRIANTSAGPIEYAESGSGFPLLSIHGAGGGYDQGLANVADLVGGEFRVIAPSRFGYLRTPIPSDASFAAQADAHAALLDELKVNRAVVVGTSAGARSAAAFALRHPDRVAALVLMVPGTYAPDSPLMIEGSRGSRFAFWLVNAGADFAWWATATIAPSVLIRFMGVPPELVAAAAPAERDRVMRIVRNVEPLSQRFPGINVDSNPDSARPRFENIRAPALVISAKDDLFNTLPAAEFAASTIPNAKLIVYATGGHLLVGRQHESRNAVRDFLAASLSVP